MKLSYKYRIYPNREQAEIIQRNFNFSCFLYNCALQERNSFYKKYGKSISYNQQSKVLPEIKLEFALQTQSIYSQSLQQVLKRLDVSFQNFFRRVKQKGSKIGFPRFKSADSFKSIVFPQSDLNGFGVKLQSNNKLKIFGIPGEVKINMHRPFQGKCKQVILTEKACKFYIILSCDNVAIEPMAKTGKTIGIDLGLNSFITADDGTKFHHPKPYKTAKEKLAFLNRKLADKQRGSNNRNKTKQSLLKAYEKVSNIRNNFLHKTANQLVKENDIIMLEKLNVKSMLESKGFDVSKSNIQDASWAKFVCLLNYKAERAGKLVITVNPANTSKMCSECGNIKELTLADREYNCSICNTSMDRDLNAAKNIKRLGMSLAIDKTISEAIRL